MAQVALRRLFATPRRLLVTATFLTLSVIFVLYLYNHAKQVADFISYASRPLWDHPDGPRQVLTHYYAEGMPIDEALCRLHGWMPRPKPLPEVWDAIMVSSELDLVEIRMHELAEVVDRVFIVESNRTFTGVPKPTIFASALSGSRFASFAGKLTYSLFPGMTPQPKDPFVVENAQRDHMTRLLVANLDGARPQPLVIFSDVDEIPSAHTIKLLRTCQSPSPLHLQLRDYVYSFEWPMGFSSWRAQVHQWDSSTYYRHSNATDVVLADSGWHCSYCFRTLSEFAAKMQGFSHADRVRGDFSLLANRRIQRVICEGTDIFDMLPEAYRYRDFLEKWYPDASRTGVSLPRYLLENYERFRYLLPGGCLRGE